MGKNDDLIMIAVIGIGGYFAYTHWEDIKKWLQGNAPNPDAAAFNSLPTIGNARSNLYRSVSIDTNPNARANAAARIKQQSDFSNPTTAKDTQAYLNATKANGGVNQCGSAFCKQYPFNCPKCASSGYTYGSFMTHTLQSVRS